MKPGTNNSPTGQEDGMNSMYRGQVVDRLTGVVVYESRTCSTWEEAQRRADRMAAGRGDRYQVRVV